MLRPTAFLLATMARSMPKFGLLMIGAILPLQLLPGLYSSRERMLQVVQDIIGRPPIAHYITVLAQGGQYRGVGSKNVWLRPAANVGRDLVVVVVALVRVAARFAAQSSRWGGPCGSLPTSISKVCRPYPYERFPHGFF